jgi:hypothetical protein
MTSQRISPGSTIQPNIDPWLSASRSAFALPRELALSYCIQFISAKGEARCCPSNLITLSALQSAGAALRCIKNILYNRALLLLNDLIGHSYSAIPEKKIIIKSKIKTRSWEARKRGGLEAGKLGGEEAGKVRR